MEFDMPDKVLIAPKKLLLNVLMDEWGSLITWQL